VRRAWSARRPTPRQSVGPVLAACPSILAVSDVSLFFPGAPLMQVPVRRLTASTACFHYSTEGERCQGLCLDPAKFCCPTHLYQYQHTPTPQLLQDAARSVLDCTTFTEQGLPRLTCTKLSDWRRLCNALNALAWQGYHDEAGLLTVLAASLESIRGPWLESGSSLVRKGKPFERLVARLYLEELAPFIRAAASPGHVQEESVRVLWDQKLPSKTGATRQIDVLLQWFRNGQQYLTLVECKDHEVEVGEMDAFATLLRHIGAEHGVLVSSVGFQSGAKNCARLEGIEALVVTEEDFSAEAVERVIDLCTFETALIHLEPVDAKDPVPLEVPSHQIQVMRGGIITGTVADLVNDLAEAEPPVPGTMPPRIDAATPGIELLFPSGKRAALAGVHITLMIRERRVRRTLVLPRHPLAFSIRRPLVGSARTVEASKLPLFPPPSLEPGQFYVNQMGQAYHCEAVDSMASTARLVLLADRQRDAVLDVEILADLGQSQHFYPVTDKGALKTLEVDLARYRKISAG
jgi:hypothetical protein